MSRFRQRGRRTAAIPRAPFLGECDAPLRMLTILPPTRLAVGVPPGGLQAYGEFAPTSRRLRVAIRWHPGVVRRAFGGALVGSGPSWEPIPFVHASAGGPW